MPLVICSVAFAASLLTLFSGFGLGTLLLPAFAAFFPIDAAVAMTALVHFANNLFKLALLGRNVDIPITLRFGVPAVAASFLGARLLLWLADLPPLLEYALGGHPCSITPVKLLIAVLMLAFAAIEAIPSLEGLAFDRRYLPLGGALSGFFGGLSGQQGAMRSAFLLLCGLTGEGFVATGVVVACLVDVTRLAVYFQHFSKTGIGENSALLGAASASAFLGAWIGVRLLKKVTVKGVRRVVSVMLVLFAAALGSGIL